MYNGGQQFQAQERRGIEKKKKLNARLYVGKVKRKRGPENGTDVRGIYTQAGGETENFALSSSEGG